MKHGPIALLDTRTPVVCVATESPVLDKVLANPVTRPAAGATRATTSRTTVDAALDAGAVARPPFVRASRAGFEEAARGELAISSLAEESRPPDATGGDPSH